LVNTNANGLWAITVLSSTTFSLNGSSGNGVGVATGYAIDYSINPLITIPDDGDALVASSVNPAFEGIFNPVPYLYQRTGRYRLYNSCYAFLGAGAGVYAGAAFSCPHDTWTPITGTSTFPHMASIAPTDILEVDFSCGIELQSSTLSNVISACVGLQYTLDGSTYVIDNNSVRDVSSSFSSILPVRYTMITKTLLSSFTSNSFNIKPSINPVTGGNGALTCQMTSGYTLILHHYRPNA
jgi:hypothetical protein